MKLKDNFNRLSSEERLHGVKIPVIGLTGGIATGKSTVTEELEKRGLPVICADKLVKEIYASSEAKNFIKENFPTAYNEEQIDFKVLRELVFSDEKNRKAVESFIYERMPILFREKVNAVTHNFVIYDVPLLFEKELNSLVDVIATVYAPRVIQIKRIKDRDNSSDETILNILNAQWNIEEKKTKSDIVINNNGSLEDLKKEVESFLSLLMD